MTRCVESQDSALCGTQSLSSVLLLYTSQPGGKLQMGGSRKEWVGVDTVQTHHSQNELNIHIRAGLVVSSGE